MAQELVMKSHQFPKNLDWVRDAAIAQPVCTAVQIGLVDIVTHAGLEFGTLVGHSTGEIAAAYAAGCISAEDAIKIAYYRGFHASKISKRGAMIAIGAPRAQIEDLLNQEFFSGQVSIVAFNGPNSVTLSGDADMIKAMEDVALRMNIFAKILDVDTVYHLSHMAECVQPYLESLTSSKIETKYYKAGTL
ncbi:acyl transferase [Aspergillus avenaceus]|uniref:Acyl transferase n=1 Tax=Aspergillus avenaceus TaxID=36643 RepID=A0A5N6U3U3_ASPAV|nr:acyl transferase [Aspergillus avenaceus]